MIAEAGGLEVRYIILYTDMWKILRKREKRRITCNDLTDSEKSRLLPPLTSYYLEAPPSDLQIREMNY